MTLRATWPGVLVALVLTQQQMRSAFSTDKHLSMKSSHSTFSVITQMK